MHSPLEQFEGREDNEVFAELQDRYLNAGDQDAFWLMYLLVERFERRYIRKYCRKNGVVLAPSKEAHNEEVRDLAGDMAVWFLDMYKHRENFQADKMSSYAHFAFLKIFFDENRVAEDKRRKELADRTPTSEDEVFAGDVFETTEEREARWHQEKQSDGSVQGILDLF